MITIFSENLTPALLANRIALTQLASTMRMSGELDTESGEALFNALLDLQQDLENEAGVVDTVADL